MTAVTFFVHGNPMPQGNKTAFVRNGKAVLVEGRRPDARVAFAAWRADVSEAARRAMGERDPFNEPVRVCLHFVFPRLASDHYRTRHVSPPDLDKLERAVLDAMTGVVYRDDSLVFSLSAEKQHGDGEPGVTVNVFGHGIREFRDRADLKQRAASARRTLKALA